MTPSGLSIGMSLKTNRFLRALARGSSSLRIKLRKPLNTKEEGVSPGCTRLLRKNTCRHTRTHRPQVFLLSASRASRGEREHRPPPSPTRLVHASVTHLHLLADESVRPRSVGVGKQLGQARFSLFLHSIAVGHSEQVDPVAIQRVAQQFSMVIQTARFAVAGGRRGKRESVGGKVRGKKLKGTNGIQFEASPRHLPAWTELSSIWVALVKLLQHLLALSVGEWVAEGEVGGGSSGLQNPVSEGEDELVFHNLKGDRNKKQWHAHRPHSCVPIPSS